MVKNKLGKKLVGTALSMAMAVTAIPAMTSLACERIPEGNFGVMPMVISRNVSCEELAERLAEVRNYYYQNEDIIPDDAKEQFTDTFDNIASMIDDFYKFRNSSGRAYKDLNEIYNDITYFVNCFDSSYKHAYAPGPLAEITLDELIARFTEVANYYYQNESKIPMGLHPQSEATLNYVSRVMRNPDATPYDYAIAKNDLESLNTTITFFADSDLPIVENGLIISADETETDEPVAPDYGMDLEAQDREFALSNLYDTLYEMADFYEVFENEIAATVGIDYYVSWVDFGMDVYCDNEAFSIDEIDELNETLQNVYASTIDAIDAASQPAEEIAPDYGMDLDEDTDDGFVIDHQDDFKIYPDFEIDPQDSFTIEGEDPAAEDEFVAPDYGMDLDDETDDESVIDHQDDITIDSEDPAVEDEFVAPDYGMDLDEFVAPDYGMDLDENTADETTDETPAPEATADETTADETTTDETSAPETTSSDEVAAPETTVETSSSDEVAAPAAPSAPAAQVLGAARDRRAIAEYIVERLYNSVLNRASDAAGKALWVNTILDDNNNLDMVIAGFVTSAEFNARRLSDDEFIALLYRVMLNRAPSDSEKNLWMSALSNGATRNDVVNAFIISDEFEAASVAYGL